MMNNNANDLSSEGEQNSVGIPPLISLDGEGEKNTSNQDGVTMYKYRDFGNLTEDQLKEESAGPNGSPCPSPPPPSRSEGSSIRVQKFPVKLYAILGKQEFQEIITWMPHGRSWKVLKPNLFESMVMPLFFEYSNYHSFNRLINAWSFRRISSGPDRGSYYHELFLRGMPHLQKYMRRLPKTHKKLPMNKDDEPDFYKMDKKNPLPPMEDTASVVPLGPSASAAAGMNGGNPMMVTPPRAMQLPGGLSGRGAAGMMPPSMMHANPNAGASIPTTLRHLNRNRMGMNADEIPFMPSGVGSMSMGMGGMGAAGMMGMSGAASRAGINHLREQQGLMGAGHDPLLGASSAFSPAGGYHHQASPEVEDQYQRLRQIQQMKLLESRPTMGGNPLMYGGAGDPFADPFAASMMQADNSAMMANRMF